MPLPNFSDSIEKNIIRHIKYRGTIRTGEITVDNGDETYDVKIAMSDQSYPDVETLFPNDVFQVGEIVTLGFEYGSKEIPKIIGHGKKVAQTPVDVEVDYSGIARVETLNSYSITTTTAYLEGRIALGGAGNCTTRGFEYGLTTAYGDDTHTDGSYGSGSYNLQITSLTLLTTYHFRAYIIDENGDTINGDDNTFKTTGTIDIGNSSFAYSASGWSDYTLVVKNNPANASGRITSVSAYMIPTAVEDCTVATFYVVSGNNLSTRDSYYIGSFLGTATVDLAVETGDYIGIYYKTGLIHSKEIATYGIWHLAGNNIPCVDTTFTVVVPDTKLMLGGSGQ